MITTQRTIREHSSADLCLWHCLLLFAVVIFFLRKRSLRTHKSLYVESFLSMTLALPHRPALRCSITPLLLAWKLLRIKSSCTAKTSNQRCFQTMLLNGASVIGTAQKYSESQTRCDHHGWACFSQVHGRIT